MEGPLPDFFLYSEVAERVTSVSCLLLRQGEGPKLEPKASTLMISSKCNQSPANYFASQSMHARMQREHPSEVRGSAPVCPFGSSTSGLQAMSHHLVATAQSLAQDATS